MSILDSFKLVELITTRTDAVVTIGGGNNIKFNAATHVDLDYPAYIQMFVDEKGKKFAIKVCKETDPQAVKFSRPKGEQKYPIKTTCATLVKLIRKMMDWDEDQGMNVPGAIFHDEGVIIFALEQAYPVTSKGGWTVKKQREAAAAEAAAAGQAFLDENSVEE